MWLANHRLYYCIPFVKTRECSLIFGSFGKGNFTGNLIKGLEVSFSAAIISCKRKSNLEKWAYTFKKGNESLVVSVNHGLEQSNKK